MAAGAPGEHVIVGALLVVAGLGVVAWGRAHIELVAAVLTGAAILTPYYTFNREDTPMDDLVITRHADGTIHVGNAPIPEHIEISRELFGGLPSYDPQVDGDTGLEPPAEPMWLEVVAHADPDQDNAGYVLHVDADNATCAYRIPAVPEDGSNVRATLASWGEK